jgi:hypothetical protein
MFALLFRILIQLKRASESVSGQAALHRVDVVGEGGSGHIAFMAVISLPSALLLHPLPAVLYLPR